MATKIEYTKQNIGKGKVKVRFYEAGNDGEGYEIPSVADNSLSIEAAIAALVAKRKKAGASYPGEPKPKKPSVTV